jgi:protocatechuate 3,4-dioxygenase beta subunit
MKTRLSRRQALGALGTVSLGGLLAACGDDGAGGSATVRTIDGATATVEPKTTTSRATDALFDESARCAVTTEQTEGPYYFDADRVRRDIREDREGTRLRLALRVRDAGSCEPLPDAVVDVWHADAGGAYSGFDDDDDGDGDGDGDGGDGAGGAGAGGRGAGGAQTATRYLRGAQVTNDDGIVEFTTIYPGWYPGRTVHIHVKVHLDAQAVLTTQLYFDDALSDRVYAARPYAARGTRDQANDSDGIFDASLVMTAKADGDGVRGVMTFDVRRA